MTELVRRDNLLDKDEKQVNSYFASLQKVTSLVPEADDEYSDPETDYDESSDTEDPLDDLLDIDIRNLDQPEKLPKLAETIFTLAQEDIQSISSSVEQIYAVQTDISPDRHEVGVKWLFQIQGIYRMSSDTLFEAAAYLNIVMSNRNMTRHNFQLYVVTCIWMAAKIEERSYPKLEHLLSMCGESYSSDDFLRCERDILQILDYRLNYPTAKLFLRRLLDVIDADGDIVEVSYFFCDLSLVHVDILDFPPDVVALACACLGKVCLNQFCPTKRMMMYGHIDDIKSTKLCAERLLAHAPLVVGNEKHFLYERYTIPELTGAVTRMNLSPEIVSEI